MRRWLLGIADGEMVKGGATVKGGQTVMGGGMVVFKHSRKDVWEDPLKMNNSHQIQLENDLVSRAANDNCFI